MKYILIITVLILGCVSCFQDKGNYDYRPVNELVISGIPEDVWIEKLTYVDTLRFQPDITSSLYEKGKEPYTYEWKLMGKSSETTDTTGNLIDFTIARTKDLNYPLVEKSGDYCGFFWVKDTLTGIQKKQDFYLRLRTAVSDGWMILCDEDGEARLDMISNMTETEDLISRNIWKDNDYKIGKPIRLCFSYRLQGSNRLVRTEKGTWNMDGETMAVSAATDMNLMFGIVLPMIPMANQVFCVARNSRADLMVLDDGSLYGRNPDDYGDVYGNLKNYTAESWGEELFECSPWIGCPNGSYKLEASVILYDNTNQCFREYLDDYSMWNYPQELQLSSGNVSFDIYTGMDLLYMECTKDNYTFAVCGEELGKQYIYGIEHGEGGKNYPRYYMELRRNESDKILKYAFAPENRYLFYLTDKNEIYQYNLEEPNTPAQRVLTFPGEQITVLKFNKLVGSIAYESWQRARESMLVVGSYKNDGTELSESGIMRLYEVPKLMRPLELKKQWENLGKIVDIAYRETGK